MVPTIPWLGIHPTKMYTIYSHTHTQKPYIKRFTVAVFIIVKIETT